MGLTEVSSASFWKERDRTFWLLAILTVFGGLIGLDHIYLRSFNTALFKLIVNIFFLGAWFIWDIVQLVADHKDVADKGFRLPFAPYANRVGAGVISPPAAGASPSRTTTPAATSIFIYALLAIVPLTGFVGIDRWYAGSWLTGIVKFIWNICLFGSWYFYDIFNVLFREETVLKEGLLNPPPFSSTVIAKGDFLPTTGSHDASPSLFRQLWNLLYSILTLTDVVDTVVAVAPAPIPQVVTAAKTQLETTVESAKTIVELGQRAGKLMQRAASAGPEVAAEINKRITEAAASKVASALDATGTAGIASATKKAMKGGGVATVGASGAIILAVITILCTIGVYKGIKLVMPGKSQHVSEPGSDDVENGKEREG